VPKDNNRRPGKSSLDESINHLGIGHYFLPATTIRKVTQVVTVAAMPPMIVNAYSKSTFNRLGGKSCVAVAMFAEAVKNLDDAAWLPFGRPKLSVNVMTVYGGQNLALVI